MTYAVAKVRAGAEKDYADRLEEADQEVFLPTVKTLSRPSGMRWPVKTERPRFPSYLFVKAETIRYLDPVYQDRRFHGFLKIAHEIGLVSEAVIKALRAWDGCETLPDDPEVPGYAPGTLLRVRGMGAFHGYRGYVELSSASGVRLNGYDFTVAVQITDLKLLEEYVESAA